MNIKIKLFTEYLADYRIEIYKELSKNFNILIYYLKIHPKLHYKIRKEYNTLRKICFRINGSNLLYQLMNFLKYNEETVIIVAPALSKIALIGLIISYIKKLPLILWDELWYYPKGLKYILFYPLHKLLTRRATIVIVPGILAKLFYMKLGVNKNKILIVHNVDHVSVKEEHIVEAKRLKNILGLENKIVLMYFGRLVPVKNVELLVRAFIKSRLCNSNDATLIIAGEGPCEKPIKELIRKNKCKNIYLLPPRYDENKVAYYLLSDIIIIPSLKTPKGQYDTWPLVTSEAIAFERPLIISTHVGSFMDLLYDMKKNKKLIAFIFPAGKEKWLIDIFNKINDHVIEEMKTNISCIKYKYDFKRNTMIIIKAIYKVIRAYYGAKS